MTTEPVLLSNGASVVVGKKRGFLFSPDSKPILTAVKDLSWPETLKRLPWHQRVIERAFAYHGIKRSRPDPKRIIYTDEVTRFIVEAFMMSHHYPRGSDEIAKMKYEIIAGVAKLLGRKKVSWNQVYQAAKSFSKEQVRQVDVNAPHPLGWGGDVKPKIEEPRVEEPKLITRRFPKPPVLQISREVWERNPGEVRVGAMSRIDWKDRGARAAIVLREFEIFAGEGCHYNVLNGGLVSKRDIMARIDVKLEELTAAQRREYKTTVIDFVCTDIANELHSIIPIIKKPAECVVDGGEEFVRFYIMPSRILDGVRRVGAAKELVYGEEVARLLQTMRPDIKLYKTGGDTTRLKGIGTTDEEIKAGGQKISWINPRKHRLPGQFASTPADKEIREEEAAAEYLTAFTVVGGHGSSISKPGDGERQRPFLTLPVSHIPMPRREGEPSIALNQIGARIIRVQPGGKQRFVETWSLRDLARDERLFMTGIKDGANELHHKIVDAIKREEQRRGLTVGELADFIAVPRDQIEEAIKFLVEPKALKRTTWSGLYFDDESGRYNMHRDWFQERIRYPWPYEDYLELRRLLAGCLHAGYNTTDYDFVTYRLPEIILDQDVQVLEILGDLIGGLKHHMIHRGQVFSGLNYTEQEIFAAELIATVLYKVFVKRFEKITVGYDRHKLAKGELESWIDTALLLFLFIVGNHDAWQEEEGHIPGYVFQSTLVSILNHHSGNYLLARGLFTPALYESIGKKVIELPEFDAVYTFPGGITTKLMHPRKGRTKTVSQRAEESLEDSREHLADSANYHTTIVAEQWHPELGQRHAVQAGALTPITYHERGILKKVDFGPVLSVTRHHKGRAFMHRHMFYNEPLLQHPISKHTDVNQLKEKLGLLRSPVQSV